MDTSILFLSSLLHVLFSLLIPAFFTLVHVHVLLSSLDISPSHVHTSSLTCSHILPHIITLPFSLPQIFTHPPSPDHTLPFSLPHIFTHPHTFPNIFASSHPHIFESPLTPLLPSHAGVLEEGDDLLVNVNMVDDEKSKKNVEAKKGKPLYNPFEQEEEGEFGEVRIETWRAEFLQKNFQTYYLLLTPLGSIVQLWKRNATWCIVL